MLSSPGREQAGTEQEGFQEGCQQGSKLRRTSVMRQGAEAVQEDGKEAEARMGGGDRESS